MILEHDEKIDNFKEKVAKEFPTFTGSVDHMQVPDLESNLEMYAKYLEETLFELKHNPKIKEGAAAVAVLRKPYNDKINFFKGKTRELNKFIDDGVADAKALRAALVEYNKKTIRVTIARDQDEELRAAAEDLADLKAGFNDGKKALDMKIKYINILILEKDPEQAFETPEEEAESIPDQGNPIEEAIEEVFQVPASAMVENGEN